MIGVTAVICIAARGCVQDFVNGLDGLRALRAVPAETHGNWNVMVGWRCQQVTRDVGDCEGPRGDCREPHQIE